MEFSIFDFDNNSNFYFILTGKKILDFSSQESIFLLFFTAFQILEYELDNNYKSEQESD